MQQVFVLIMLSVFYISVPAGEMYKWVDEEGNVQYTQTPPPEGTEATTVTPSITNSISGGKETFSSTPTDKQAEKPSHTIPQASTCEEVSKQLVLLTTRKNLMMPDVQEPGKFIPMSEEARKQQIATAKAFLKTNECNDRAALLKSENVVEENKNAVSKTETNCEKARKYLDQTVSGFNLVVPDPDNPKKFIPMTKEDREKKIALLQGEVERFCNQ